MCLERDIKDEKSGADLRKGCQTLDGTKALAFVRQRHQEAEGDLGRTRNQQKFLTALAKKAVTPDTLLDPSKSYPTISAGLDTLMVDKDTGLQDLMSLFRAMQGVTAGNGRQINVPVSDPGFATSKGSAVKWDDAPGTAALRGTARGPAGDAPAREVTLPGRRCVGPAAAGVSVRPAAPEECGTGARTRSVVSGREGRRPPGAGRRGSSGSGRRRRGSRWPF